MKPRARRITFAAAVLGGGVIAVLVVLNWGKVRNHIEAWYFQLTRETETIEPDPASKEEVIDIQAEANGMLFRLAMDKIALRTLASQLNQPLVFDPQEMAKGVVCQQNGVSLTATQVTIRYGGRLLDLLTENGYRLLEQRFPRRAWVVIHDGPPGPRKPVVRFSRRSKRPLNPVGVYKVPQEATPTE